MINKLVDKYVRLASRDSHYVNEAIKKGARLSFEEWHDFAFKSEISSYKSSCLGRYAVMYGVESELSKIEAKLCAYIVSVQLEGFTDSTARKFVKEILKRYNKLFRFADRINFMCTDSDGILYYIVESADLGKHLKKPIDSRDSLCFFLRDLWAFLVQESGVFSVECSEFMREHMNREISALLSGGNPVPYIGCMRSATLECVLLEKTDYLASVTNTAKNSSDRSIKVVKSTGTNGSKPKVRK